MIHWILAIITVILAFLFVLLTYKYYKLKEKVMFTQFMYEDTIKELERKLSMYEKGRLN